MTQFEIRAAQTHDLDGLKNLTVLAFEPVFASFANLLGSSIYPLVYPDWKTLQSDLVESMYQNEVMSLWVADIEGQAVGLIVIQLDTDTQQGVIEFLVVHPDYQNDGIGTRLNEFALNHMREAGMKVAIVGTGGDESHAPARRAYEKVGFVPLPNVWYFKNLD